jgi:hypothetical protein
MVGMADSGGDERVVYEPPAGYEFMKQHNKASSLVGANMLSPIDLGMRISRFRDLED